MKQHPGHGHRFDQVERLRSPERVQRLQITQVVKLVLDGISAKSLLDIGTGSGLFAEAFQQKGLLVAGIDINPQMLQVAQRYLPDAELKQGAVEAIPFPNKNFDIVFMGLLLHEANDLLKALQEAHRVAHTRVAILEWPYRQTEFGPGMEERIAPEEMASIAKDVGLEQISTFDLGNLVLYRMDKPINR
jgi:ubiquinone/menaquinone biosynthesis C-methylase UbiE